jgi:alpha-mannosidase
MGDIQDYIKGWEQGIIGKFRDTMSQEMRLERLIKRLHPRRFYASVPISPWKMAYAKYTGTTPDGTRTHQWLDQRLVMTDEASRSYRTCSKPQWFDLHLNDTWGNWDVTAFARASFTVPREFHGKPMYLQLFIGGDGLLKINGEIRQGCDCFHTEIMLSDLAVAGKRLDFEIETYQKHQVDADAVHRLMVSQMSLLDTAVEEFYWDVAAAFSAANEEFADPEVRAWLLRHLDEAFKIVDVFESDHEAFRVSAIKARQYLRRTVYAGNRYPIPARIAGIGHSHLDYVYAWEYAEFLRKIGRTHSTQLRLMDEFPEFRFSQSQAITYMELKARYPDIYREIKQRVRQKRWEILGAFYSECDANIPNGESFIRNVMIGLEFFRKEFGVRPRISWQCDLFGVTWSLPQILKKCGLDYFVTHKMTVWNSDNKWPYNLYWWEGLDGTRILAHSPSSHIIQTVEGYQLQRHWKLFQEKLQCGESLYTYGWGDGGSGVTREMLQRARRYRNFPGVPRLKLGFAEDFFARVVRRARQAPDMPVWSNELYVETHRAVTTTQGILKKYNRYAEILLRNTELLASLAMVSAGARYPAAALRTAWEGVIKGQFHDGVTGTHTAKAFTDVVNFYQSAIGIAEREQRIAADALIRKVDTRGEGSPVVLFNTLTWERRDPVRIPWDGTPVRIVDADGRECVQQAVARGAERALYVQGTGVPSVGYAVYRVIPGKPTPAPKTLSVSTELLENAHLRVKLDSDGHIVSLYDKANRRECIEPGRLGNEFQLFEDISGYYEAWDLHNTNLVKRWDVRKAESVRVVESGPLRVAVEVTRKIHNSRLIQRIVLWKDSPWVDFETTIDWRDEIHRILKVAFPLNITAFTCRYDIAFGNMDRPTTRSTTWEKTKFEVAAHKWADLSDNGYGVALINDCRYGYDCEKNVLRLSLVRAPKHPNPQSDLYVHQLTYRLYPHAGDFRTGGTIRNAWEMNCPILALPAAKHPGTLPACHSFVTLHNDNVLLEALKKAEYSDDLVVRFVEHWGRRDTLRADLSFGLAGVREVNCIEEDIPCGARTSVNGIGIEDEIRAFDIKTYRCTPVPRRTRQS